MSKGFYRVPRSISSDVRFSGSHFSHRYVFIKLIELAGWHVREFNDRGKVIRVEVGQVCISLNELQKECGRGMTKDIIRGAIRSFASHRYLTQSVPHQRMLITITHPDAYDLIKNTGPTVSTIELPQISHTNEEYKELKNRNKKNKKKKTDASADASRLALLFLESIRINLPEFGNPNLDDWNDSFDSMIRIDKRPIASIEEIILMLQNHWYSPNVQCARKFRKEFIRLLGYSRESKKTQSQKRKKTCPPIIVRPKPDYLDDDSRERPLAKLVLESKTKRKFPTG